ncbi:MAG TPA: hypothetical protein VIY56_04345 [Vicinamibacterales bacterium]
MKGPVALAAVLLSVSALTSSAQAVKVEFMMGKVNLTAQNASLRAVMTEWARVGGTKIVNPERLVGQPVTIELVGVPERQALDILLRGVGGFMLGPRPALVPGVSAYDRLVVVSATAGRPAATGPAFGPSSQPARRVPPQQIEPPDDDDLDDVDVDGPVSGAPGGPGTRSTPSGLVAPGLAPLPEVNEPRPTPTAAPSRGNPFGGGAQGSLRPGEVAPAPPPNPAESRTPQNDPDR